jgi:hypothetical protein
MDTRKGAALAYPRLRSRKSLVYPSSDQTTPFRLKPWDKRFPEGAVRGSQYLHPKTGLGNLHQWLVGSARWRVF